MIKEHPILFSPAMITALLNGNKTMTRRLPGIKNSLVDGAHVTQKTWDDYYFNFSQAIIDSGILLQSGQRVSLSGRSAPFLKVPSKIHFTTHRVYPIYQSGDLLWARETYFKAPDITDKMLRDGADTWEKYYYSADTDKPQSDQLKEWGWRLRPGIYMPKEASRIWCEVVSVFPQRIQEITEEDAFKEGVSQTMIQEEFSGFDLPAKTWFNNIWNAMHPGSWRDNDLVWVTEFKILSTIGKPELIYNYEREIS
jgi:hypothetical protein